MGRLDGVLTHIQIMYTQNSCLDQTLTINGENLKINSARCDHIRVRAKIAYANGSVKTNLINNDNFEQTLLTIWLV